MESAKTCSYDKCNLPVNSPFDEQLCFGHTPLEKKGMDAETFNRNLRKDKIYKKDFNFAGFIFPTLFTFPSERPVEGNEINFKNCKFYGSEEINVNGKNEILSIDFANLHFNTSIKFENCEIHNGFRIDFGIFYHPLTLHNVEFKGIFFARKASFKSDLSIFECLFKEDVRFPEASFDKSVFINDSEFSKEAIFHKTKFQDKTSFDNSIFHDLVNFREVAFKGDSSFQSVSFNENVYFNDSTFHDFAKFHKSLFHKNVSLKYVSFRSKLYLTHIAVDKSLDLSNSRIEGNLIANNSDFIDFNLSDSQCSGLVDFNLCGFEGNTNFDRAIFLKSVDFSESTFEAVSENEFVTFHFTEFKDQVIFNLNEINNKIIFDNITQSGKTTFYFTKPIFNDNGLCIFKNIQFQPFTSYFEYISFQSFKPLLIFRYCNLKDVFFSNNNLSLFSFYKSAFDEARFILPKWKNIKGKAFLFNYSRKNIIYEDYHYSQIGTSNIEAGNSYLLLDDLDSLDEIANLYRRYKSALDKTKDYEQAGWFYFNEMEMKRLSFEGYIDPEEKFTRIKNFIRSKYKMKWLLYGSYKIFAGYGEKPLWSFLWFLIFTLIFSVLNLFIGFIYKGNIINYNLNLTGEGLFKIDSQLCYDLFISILLSIIRLIPFSYSLVSKDDFSLLGLDSLFLSFFNTITLLILVTFIGIGLKRIFRRF